MIIPRHTLQESYINLIERSNKSLRQVRTQFSSINGMKTCLTTIFLRLGITTFQLVKRPCFEVGGNSLAATPEHFDLDLIRRQGQG